MSAQNTIKNPYSSAFSSSTPASGIGGKININGVNYGSKWTADDQAIYDLYLSGLQFDNELALLDYQNDYNSPKAQAQRMREAGINPDLVGVENHASAGSSSPSPSAPVGSLETPLDRFQKVFSVGQSALTTALNMYSQIKSNNLSFDDKEMTNADKRLKLAEQLFRIYGSASSTWDTSKRDLDFSFLGGSKRSRNRWLRDVSSLARDMIDHQMPNYSGNADLVEDENRFNIGRGKRAIMPLNSSNSDADLQGTFANIRDVVWASYQFQQKAKFYGFKFDSLINAKKLPNVDMFFDAQFNTAQAQAARGQFETMINNARINDFDDYYNTEKVSRQAKRALDEYQKAYNKAMYDLLFRRGVIGMTAAMQIAHDDPWAVTGLEFLGQTITGSNTSLF